MLRRLTLSAAFAAAIGVLAGPDVSLAQTASPSVQPQNAIYGQALEFDYIQQAATLQFDGETMTLGGTGPATIFFSDRPYRLTGQVSNATFASLWDAPNGTFAQNPPNAAVSVLGKPDEPPAIVELTTAKVDGSTIAYGVKVLAGTLPDSAEEIALFVDHGPGFHGGHSMGVHGGGHVSGYHPSQPIHTNAYHPYHPYHPYYPYHPYHPVPGPYCYHSPQAPECRYHPYHPYPYYPRPYYPAGAFAAGAATGAVLGAAAASSGSPQYYTYPIPSGPLPANCWLNSNHTQMICSVPIN